MAGIMDALRGDVRDVARLVFTFTVPSTIENPFKSVGLIELRASEQILMSRMLSADASPEEQLQALVKACIYEIDGAKVNKAQSQFEILWEATHPKVRGMLRKVVTQLHIPEAKEDEDFTLSRTVRTEG